MPETDENIPTVPPKKDMVSDSSTSTASTSSRKSRRKKRRRENRNKSSRKIPTVGAKIHAKGHGNASNPWQKVRKPIKLSSIMNEQQSEQTQSPSSFAMFGDLMMDEAELLEQQMILEAIAESKKATTLSVIPPSDAQHTNHSETAKNAKVSSTEEEKTATNTSHTTSNTETASMSTQEMNTESQTEHAIHELVNGDLDEMQCLSDEMLAIHLQKEEQRIIARNQKRNAYYDGQHSKVTMASVGPANLPREALSFYYEEDSAGKRETGIDELTMDLRVVKGKQHFMSGLPRNVSKHNAKIASREHMRRLNEYEAGGNLDLEMNIGNQAYGSFKNTMDKKGIKSLHDRCFVPVEKRR